MASPVRSLADFVSIYVERLKAKDIDGLGDLYAPGAVLSSARGQDDAFWAVGRDAIKDYLAVALRAYTVIEETPPTEDFDVWDGVLAWRRGVFTCVFADGAGTPDRLSVEAVEVLMLSPAEGWQYVADLSRAQPVTRPSTGPV
ncbi:YybH family protein [Actinoplanes sp. NPDC049265]|uniref:YybH family protein n=1 Tax=Actinoplanes sp. NPDC049265 TaxID=3363902 RepID=UPI003715ED26